MNVFSAPPESPPILSFPPQNIGSRCSFGRSVVLVIPWCQIIKQNHFIMPWYWVEEREDIKRKDGFDE